MPVSSASRFALCRLLKFLVLWLHSELPQVLERWSHVNVCLWLVSSTFFFRRLVCPLISLHSCMSWYPYQMHDIFHISLRATSFSQIFLGTSVSAGVLRWLSDGTRIEIDEGGCGGLTPSRKTLTSKMTVKNLEGVEFWPSPVAKRCRGKSNKKAQLTQRERATAVHVWRPTANKCKIRKKLYFSAQGHSRSLLSVSIETRVWLPISD